MPREYFPTWDAERGIPVTLEDGNKWSNAVLEDLENANWHSARSAFKDLINLLPKVYKKLKKDNPDLAVKLQEAVDKWDMEF